MKKIIKLLKQYLNLQKIFPVKITNNFLLEKLFDRFAKYGILKKSITKFYTKKHNDILNYLENEFSDFLRTYEYIEKRENDIDKKKIFSLWLQGYDYAPELVKKTINSQRRYAEKYGYEYILLDQSNLYEYISIPDIIIEKYNNGIIDPIKYSDIVRTILLSKYGGVWLDATIYLDNTKFLDYLDSEFYTIKASGSEDYPRYVTNGRWALFCLAGEKNTIVFDFLKKIQIEYFTRFDTPIDYFLIDYLMELGYKHNSLMRKKIDQVVKNNTDLYFLVNHLNNFVNEVEWQEIKKNTQIFKCSYKVPIKNIENSYYFNLLNERL